MLLKIEDLHVEIGGKEIVKGLNLEVNRVTTHPDAAEALVELETKHDFFVGIDSDGCAFDTMEI